jgi:acetyltransferase-like isoleucine patch superfamily enzyme
MIKKIISCTLLFFLPTFVVRAFLSLLSHKIDKGVKIGFSLIWSDSLELMHSSSIGHANLIAVDSLRMHPFSSIGRKNILYGPFSVEMSSKSQIGNRNKITRAKAGVSIGDSHLHLGELSKITSDHTVDCTCPVQLGDFSILAGYRSQLWTHGYIHDETGPGRYRIDGEINIGNNVYVGSGCVISTGVTIADGIIVGAGTGVAKHLLLPGLYVSAEIRQLPRPSAPETRADLIKLEDSSLVETVYKRR